MGEKWEIKQKWKLCCLYILTTGVVNVLIFTTQAVRLPVAQVRELDAVVAEYALRLAGFTGVGRGYRPCIKEYNPQNAIK